MDEIAYRPLTEEERTFHLNGMFSSGVIGNEWVIFPVSGLLPSGEGNFFDVEQTPQTRTFYGHDGYKITIKQGAEPLTFNLPDPPFLLPIIGISGLQEYASGDIVTTYTHNAPDPSGGTGELDKLPYNFSFNPNDLLVRNSG